ELNLPSGERHLYEASLKRDRIVFFLYRCRCLRRTSREFIPNLSKNASRSDSRITVCFRVRRYSGRSHTFDTDAGSTSGRTSGGTATTTSSAPARCSTSPEWKRLRAPKADGTVTRALVPCESLRSSAEARFKRSPLSDSVLFGL